MITLRCIKLCALRTQEGHRFALTNIAMQVATPRFMKHAARF